MVAGTRASAPILGVVQIAHDDGRWQRRQGGPTTLRISRSSELQGVGNETSILAGHVCPIDNEKFNKCVVRHELKTELLDHRGKDVGPR